MVLVFFFNDTAATEIYTLSLHDALPISCTCTARPHGRGGNSATSRSPRRTWRPAKGSSRSSGPCGPGPTAPATADRSEEHTSEPQSRQYLVCRLLLEKKKHFISRLSTSN